jgi:predicted GNAT family acetyltransferase
MQHVLNNPAYNALVTGCSHLSACEGPARFFPKEVSPFAGLQQYDEHHFALLYKVLPPKSTVALFTAQDITIPQSFTVTHKSVIYQMTGENVITPEDNNLELVDLDTTHVPEMLALTKLTNPGPFATRTIEFGHYKGIFVNGQLVAMAGHRLHAGPFIEISAVCTHPNFTGKGYARALMIYQANSIKQQGNTPFLHVRTDNTQAIALYKKLGFAVRSDINLHIIKN